MPVETNMLMSFLEQVERARRARQQEVHDQPPAAPEMPEWSKRLNPDDFTGTTREMLLKAQSAAPGGLQQPVGRAPGIGDAPLEDWRPYGPPDTSALQNPVDRAPSIGNAPLRNWEGVYGPPDTSALQRASGSGTTSQQQMAPSPENMGITDQGTVRAGINQVMEEERQRQPTPAPINPDIMRDHNRVPIQGFQPEAPRPAPRPLPKPAQGQTSEPAAEMPRQQNAAPAASQGGQPVNLRKALGPHVGGPGDFVQMAQRARQTGEMPGGRTGGQGQATAMGGAGSDRLAGGARSQPTATRGGGMFGGSGPGLGYVIGGLGSLLQEASGQTGAASQFAQTYGGQLQARREANQTRQLALQLGIPEDIAATAPIDILKPIIGDAYKRSVQGNQPQWEYKDGQWYRIDEQGPTPFGEPNPNAGDAQKWNDVVLEYPDGRKVGINTGTPEGIAAAERAMQEGAVPVKTPGVQVTNQIGGEQTPGQKKADEAFADEYQSWVTGGFSDVQTQIAQLDAVAEQLESGAELSGPAIGIAYQQLSPDLFAAQFPEAQAALDNVSEVIQRSLRETLGAQMAEQEAERFIARAYNMSLPPEENARRVRRAVEKLRRAAEAKDAAVEYFGEHGTLDGFDYRSAVVPSLLDDEPQPDTGGGRQREQAPAQQQQPKRLRFNPETGQLEEVR